LNSFKPSTSGVETLDSAEIPVTDVMEKQQQMSPSISGVESLLLPKWNQSIEIKQRRKSILKIPSSGASSNSSSKKIRFNDIPMPSFSEQSKRLGKVEPIIIED
jgi:hypothetical protein